MIIKNKGSLCSLVGGLMYLTSIFSLQAQAPDLSLNEAEVKVTKIWDQEPPNAFTDLIRFNDQIFCNLSCGRKTCPSANP